MNLKIALAALLIAIGALGLQAQNGRGSGNGLGNGMGNGTVNGNCTTQLTSEQKAIIEEMRLEFQAEMEVLRAEILAANTLAEKVEIFKEMKALRTAHKEAVKAQLAEWGITTNDGKGHKGNGKKHRGGGRG